MPAKFSEFIGFILGAPFGLFFAAGSLLRNSRFFHPQGLVFSAETANVDGSLPLPANAIVRFSGAWWKSREWPDVLGVTIRFRETAITDENSLPGDQDLLFASFRRPWQMFAAPFFTEYEDFLANNYFAVSPFELRDGRIVDFMLDPGRGHRTQGTREEKLQSSVLAGSAILRLMMKEREEKSWKLVARITLLEEVALDQEALRFHPFRCMPGIRPYGFLHHLRFVTYRMSQRVRPGIDHPLRSRESASPS